MFLSAMDVVASDLAGAGDVLCAAAVAELIYVYSTRDWGLGESATCKAVSSLYVKTQYQTFVVVHP